MLVNGNLLGAQEAKGDPWVAPPAVKRAHNPVFATAEAVNRGRELYIFNCAQCHGRTGLGDGPESYSLQARLVDLAAPHVLAQTDGELFWKISNGRNEMPKSRLDERGVWTIVHYLRTLPSTRPLAHRNPW